jgi:hypothetical protein
MILLILYGFLFWLVMCQVPTGRDCDEHGPLR